MNLHIQPVTPQNRATITALHAAPNQKGFVEDVSECLRKADHRRCWRPVAIYDGDTPVGFAMYGFFWEYPPFGRVWLDRLLIDARYQCHGYGRAAMELLLQRIALAYGRKKIYLSVVAGNDHAIALYQKFGFRFNGQKDVHGEDVMIRRAPKPS